jgi:hypothetical protein
MISDSKRLMESAKRALNVRSDLTMGPSTSAPVRVKLPTIVRVCISKRLAYDVNEEQYKEYVTLYPRTIPNNNPNAGEIKDVVMKIDSSA